jgi:5-methylcytosine-specific restriction endonuclease McrA
MDDALRLLVRERARHSCEYCRLAARDAPFLAFHVDHIIARQHGGTDDPDNPALACLWCNLHKGPNLSGIDPETGQITALFHPRRDQWSAHFALRGVHISSDGLLPDAPQSKCSI